MITYKKVPRPVKQHKTFLNDLKGVWHEILSFKFFYKSVSPGPLSVPLGPFGMFLKIRGDIRESMFISGVDNTCDKRGKFWGVIIFIFFKIAYLSALYSCKFNFCLFFIFRPRQAGIVGTVLSAMSLTPAKSLSAVSLTQAINFRLFGYFWPLVSLSQAIIVHRW